MVSDPLKVKSVVVEVECFHCCGNKRVSGGKCQSQGEVIPCPVCNGRGVVRESCSLSLLYDLLMGNLVGLPPRASGSENK